MNAHEFPGKWSDAPRRDPQSCHARMRCAALRAAVRLLQNIFKMAARMSRHRAEFWMLWLLPLLVMRLLLPSGVMPAHSPHGFALVLCSSQHLRSAPDAGNAHADALCPFAAAVTAAPPTSLIEPVAAATQSSLAALTCRAQCVGQSGAARTQVARAPPSFS